MKKIFFIFCLFFLLYSLNARDNSVEKEIRRLEQMEVYAVLMQDPAMLLK